MKKYLICVHPHYDCICKEPELFYKDEYGVHYRFPSSDNIIDAMKEAESYRTKFSDVRFADLSISEYVPRQLSSKFIEAKENETVYVDILFSHGDEWVTDMEHFLMEEELFRIYDEDTKTFRSDY